MGATTWHSYLTGSPDVTSEVDTYLRLMCDVHRQPALAARLAMLYDELKEGLDAPDSVLLVPNAQVRCAAPRCGAVLFSCLGCIDP